MIFRERRSSQRTQDSAFQHERSPPGPWDLQRKNHTCLNMQGSMYGSPSYERCNQRVWSHEGRAGPDKVAVEEKPADATGGRGVMTACQLIKTPLLTLIEQNWRPERTSLASGDQLMSSQDAVLGTLQHASVQREEGGKKRRARVLRVVLESSSERISGS